MSAHLHAPNPPAGTVASIWLRAGGYNNRLCSAAINNGTERSSCKRCAHTVPQPSQSANPAYLRPYPAVLPLRQPNPMCLMVVLRNTEFC